MDDFIPAIAIVSIFLGLPWIIFHYITKWKSVATITREDENLLEELYQLARRLEERVCTVERIMTAENPDWRQVSCDPLTERVEDHGFARRIGQ